MKKLMIVAAAAVCGGAFAAATSCGGVAITEIEGSACGGIAVGEITTIYEECCTIWDLKMTLNTLAPKKLACKGCKCDCEDDGSTWNYLDDATRKLEGYMWTCECDCETLMENGPNIVLWETKTKSPVIPLKYYLSADGKTWEQNACNLVNEGGTYEIYRYGKKATKVAMYWDFDISGWYELCPGFLAAAGTKGKGIKIKTDDVVTDFDDPSCYALTLKSISGYVVSKWPINATFAQTCWGIHTYAIRNVGMCECFKDWCADEYFEEYANPELADGDLIPAYGKWSLKYNKKLSVSGKSMLGVVPAYALIEE